MQKSTRQRREEIERIIQEEGNVRVEFLSQHFQVTKETIRTDLQYLENKGSIHRTHGGALRREGQYDVPFEIRHSRDNFKSVGTSHTFSTKTILPSSKKHTMSTSF